MVSKRDRILKLVDYIESCNIKVNIAKNKARGKQGYFATNGKFYRIDIAKNLTEDAIIRLLAHEFAHFVHYNYDKTLQKLDFVFDSTDTILEELLKITVNSIPKENVLPLFNAKDVLKTDIKNLSNELKLIHPDYKINENNKLIEKRINKTNLKFLLSHDNVKLINGFTELFYSIDNLNTDLDIELYLKIKSKKRALNRINSKITKMNKYYNSPTELFARFFEMFVMEKDKLQQIAPFSYAKFEKVFLEKKIPYINNFIKCLECK